MNDKTIIILKIGPRIRIDSGTAPFIQSADPRGSDIQGLIKEWLTVLNLRIGSG